MAINNFTLSAKLDKNRVFILQKSELEKRLDPTYYIHEFNNYEKKLVQKPYQKFAKLVKSINNGFDFREYKESGTPYLKVANIKQGEIDFTKIQYVDFSSTEISKNIQLKKGNILLTRKGTFGNAFALDKNLDFVISSEIFYIELIEDSINPKFLEIFFNSKIGQAQFDKNKIGAIMGSLSQTAIRELKIPLPSSIVQNQTVRMYNNYILQKQQNEAEAEKLLATIDDYLLNELGIKLPKPPENTLKNRMFTASIKEISTGRFDPKLYSNQSQNLIKSLFETKFKYQTLKSITTQSCAGDWGNDDKEKFNDEEFIKCLVIRATEFDNKFNLNVDGSRAKFRLINRAKFLSLDIKSNDLLLEKSGGSENQPVGRVSILTKELTENYSLGFSNFVHKIRVDDKIVLPNFVFNYLKTVHNIKITDVMQSQTNGIRNLIMNEYFNLPIPIPPLEKQKEIADHITAIRMQAQNLKDKTKEALAQASKEIENLLLN